MSEDTQNKTRSAGEMPPESSENIDPTVQISNAELAAIRQSGSQPSFSRETVAEMERWRESDASRQRAPTPQYGHPSVGEAGDANSDPTRSFDRARIDAMLQSQHSPTSDEDLKVPQAHEKDAGVADAAIAAESRAASADEPLQELPPQQDTPQSPEDAEDLAEREDDLAFLDDGIFREIVFGDTDSKTNIAGSDQTEAAEEPVHSEPPVEASPSEPEPMEESVPEASQQDEALAEIGVPDLHEVEFEDENFAPAPAASDDEQEAWDRDDSSSKKSPPLLILCAVIGMLAICGATVGLVFPDAAFVLPPLRNALVLAAGAMLVYLSIILRP